MIIINKEIKKLSDFVETITSGIKSSNLTRIGPSYTFYYRGQAESSWPVWSSLFRKDHLYRDEDKIINAVLSRCPADFSDDKTQFEKLVRMQHFGFPTRLLDITLNPLVALFFACQNLEDKDGAVYMEYTADSKIKIFNDPEVSKKSNISRLSHSEKITLDNKIDELKKKIDEEKPKMAQLCMISHLFDEIDEWKNKIEKEKLNMVPSDPTLHILNNSFNDKEEDYLDYEYLLQKQFQSEEVVEIMNKLIMQENHFNNEITFDDLSNGLIVRPSWQNERIKAQQGLFFLPGIKRKFKIFRTSSVKKIIIPAKNKSLLKKELDIFGINQMTLFPDLPGVGQYIEEYFRPTI